MSLRRQNNRRGLMAEINVVPYIDVMLVLVVILMVAAPFVNPSVVNLPSVNKASKAPETVVEVIVYPDGRLSLRSGKEMRPTDAAFSRFHTLQIPTDHALVLLKETRDALSGILIRNRLRIRQLQIPGTILQPRQHSRRRNGPAGTIHAAHAKTKPLRHLKQRHLVQIHLIRKRTRHRLGTIIPHCMKLSRLLLTR